MQAVWGDTIVEEGGLARNISVLRKTLGESPDEHRYIVTAPGRGYCFVATVRNVEREDPNGARVLGFEKPALSLVTSTQARISKQDSNGPLVAHAVQPTTEEIIAETKLLPV